MLLLLVVLELRSVLGVATVAGVGRESERLGVTDGVRTVIVKEGALFRTSGKADPVFGCVDNGVPEPPEIGGLLLDCGEGDVDSGGTDDIIELWIGGETGFLVRSLFHFINLFRAAVIFSGNISLSLSSFSSESLVPSLSLAELTEYFASGVEVATGGETCCRCCGVCTDSSCSFCWRGGQMRLEEGREVNTGFGGVTAAGGFPKLPSLISLLSFLLSVLIFSAGAELETWLLIIRLIIELCMEVDTVTELSDAEGVVTDACEEGTGVSMTRTGAALLW